MENDLLTNPLCLPLKKMTLFDFALRSRCALLLRWFLRGDSLPASVDPSFFALATSIFFLRSSFVYFLSSNAGTRNWKAKELKAAESLS